MALSPPIIPEWMSVRRLDNGELEYRWVENGKQRVETQGRIVHIRGLGGSPLGGLSTLSFGRQAFGMAQALDRAASATCRKGVRQSGLSGPKDSRTAQQTGDGENKINRTAERGQGSQTV